MSDLFGSILKGAGKVLDVAADVTFELVEKATPHMENAADRLREIAIEREVREHELPSFQVPVIPVPNTSKKVNAAVKFQLNVLREDGRYAVLFFDEKCNLLNFKGKDSLTQQFLADEPVYAMIFEYSDMPLFGTGQLQAVQICKLGNLQKGTLQYPAEAMSTVSAEFLDQFQYSPCTDFTSTPREMLVNEIMRSYVEHIK